VGVYEALDPVSTMKPVVTNVNTTFTQLLDGLEELEDTDHVQNQINQLLAKLQRVKRKLNPKTLEHFSSMTGGKTPDQFIADVHQKPAEEGRENLLSHRPALELLDERVPGRKRIVISDMEDELLEVTRGYGKENISRPEDYLEAFSSYIKNNVDEIAALNIVCTRPKELTRDSLRSLALTLDREGFTQQQLNTAVSQVTNEEITADIITLIRRYAIGSALMSHSERIRQAVTKLKKAHDFSRQELSWLGRMEKYLMEESVLNVRVFDEDSRFRNKGGFRAIDRIFGGTLESVVQELNEYLYDDGGHSA
jgi:type I restriction enzyme R subunit